MRKATFFGRLSCSEGRKAGPFRLREVEGALAVVAAELDGREDEVFAVAESANAANRS